MTKSAGNSWHPTNTVSKDRRLSGVIESSKAINSEVSVLKGETKMTGDLKNLFLTETDCRCVSRLEGGLMAKEGESL